MEHKRFAATRRGKQDGLEKYLNLLSKNKIDEDYFVIQNYFEYPQIISYFSNKNKILKYYLDNIETTCPNKNLKINNKIIKHEITYKDRDYIVKINYFDINVGLILIDIYAPKNNISNYYNNKNSKGFINVTYNDLYEDTSILNRSIKKNRVVIEGPKGIGKQGVINAFIEKGILCQDRDIKCISNDNIFSLPLEKRCNEYYKRINKDPNEYFLFLTSNNINELNKRIINRKKIETSVDSFKFSSKYYNKAYKESYEYMKTNHLLNNKLFLVDCDNLSESEQIDACLNIYKNTIEKTDYII